ncbi:MAG TPA: hypothetical protein VGM67_17330 [Gemmatimonadaceae bacterium]
MSVNSFGVDRRFLCVTVLAISCALAANAHAQQSGQRQPPRADSAHIDSATVAASHSLAADEAAGMKFLGIYDKADGSWVAGATIRDTLGNQVVTSLAGVAPLSTLVPIAGYYLVEIRKAGYAPRFLRLAADTTSEILVPLAPNPLGGTTLAPTIVTAKRQLTTDAGMHEGFVNRCQTGLVSCLGRNDLDRHPAGGFDALLGHVDGVVRECMHSAGPPSSLMSRPGVDRPVGCTVMMRPLVPTANGTVCVPNYVINGFTWPPVSGTTHFSAADQAELEKFLNSTTIDGIEVYLPGHPIPPRFDPAPFSACGAVVIWTR